MADDSGRINQVLSETSFLYGGNAAFVEDLYSPDLRIRQLLYFFTRALLIIRRDQLVLRRLFDLLVAVAPDVADRRLMILERLVQLLHHVLAPASSVIAGIGTRITLPSVIGFNPVPDVRIAFSIALTIPTS